MDRKKLIVLGMTLVLVITLMAGCGQQAKPPDNGSVVEGIDSLEMVNLITSEWKASGKQFAQSYAAGRSGNTCASCHDGHGFSVKDEIDFVTGWNPGGANEAMETYPEHLTGIDCQSCHTGVGLGYINSGKVELPYATIDNAGKGAACMFCHSGRRNTPAEYEAYAAGGATRFSYPHYGPAAIMTGQGGMEYPNMDYASTGAHAGITDSCVACHMPETKEGYLSHTFTMDTAYIAQTCGTCHNGIDTYNMGGYQDNIKAMMAKLEEAIKEATGAVAVGTDVGQLKFENAAGEAMTIEEISIEAFVAGYNWYGVKSDGSYGIHNPKYTESLLKNSYRALTGKDM
jgi:formate-dependent nitrite reductase cytochrome c552 subunit